MTYARSLLVAAFMLGAPLMVHAADDATVPTNPGFNPDSGQINSGPQAQAPSQSSESRPIPTTEESRAALFEPTSAEPSLGEAAASAIQPGAATTASGAIDRQTPLPGPIGATGQTMPAKFSARNDILDRTPIMALPLKLSDAERKQIFDAVMADKSQSAAGAERLSPASELSTEQALNGMHPLPDALRGIELIQRLKYVKAKDKVLLVEPATRTVVDEIKS